MDQSMTYDEYKQKVKEYIEERPAFLNAGASPHWIPAYDLPFILEMRKNLIGLEIGTSHGHSTYFLLKMLPNSTIHGIDPYVHYDQMNDTDKAYEAFQNVLEEFGDRVVLHQTASDEAIDEFQDGMFDFIFIDGIHTYEQVKKDIENYYPKIKEGGYIFGHDWSAWSAASHHFRDVEKKGVDTAAKEMAALYKKQWLNCKSDCWYWRK